MLIYTKNSKTWFRDHYFTTKFVSEISDRNPNFSDFAASWSAHAIFNLPYYFFNYLFMLSTMIFKSIKVCWFWLSFKVCETHLQYVIYGGSQGLTKKFRTYRENDNLSAMDEKFFSAHLVSNESLFTADYGTATSGVEPHHQKMLPPDQSAVSCGEFGFPNGRSVCVCVCVCERDGHSM